MHLIGLFAALLGSSTCLIYILTIFKGQTRPHTYTWLVWTILTGIGFAAQISEGAGTGAWTLGLVALLNGTITILSLKYGSKDRTKSDLVALLCALFAIIPWIVLKDPVISVILISLINTIGFYPTFRKSWHNPQQENLFPYGLSTISMLISLMAIENLTVASSLFTVTIAACNTTFVLYSLWRKKVLNQTALKV